jgi:preprotein translocase subunit SecF
MIWGVVIGTFSSIYVASPIVLHLPPPRETAAPAAKAAEG